MCIVTYHKSTIHMMSKISVSCTYARFTPKFFVNYELGMKQLRIHPKHTIGDNWPDIDTNLALNINKTSLIMDKISSTLVVDTLASNFGTATQVHIHFQTFISVAKSQIHNPDNLKVNSYH